MHTIGILERGGGLSAFLTSHLPPALLEESDLCPAGSLAAGEVLDLLVVSPDWTGEDRAVPPCRAMLIPGRLAQLTEGLTASWAVSFGLSPKDTLTLSSMGENTIHLALQREIVTLTGQRLDPQEFPLARQDHTALCQVLACVGVQLLLGVEPGEVFLA
ncbi:MAG: hypothetical protein IKY34_04250 [Ruminiclostridium sp.]|nr:hypothetical protein [Ruminiclostridium sp.]